MRSDPTSDEVLLDVACTAARRIGSNVLKNLGSAEIVGSAAHDIKLDADYAADRLAIDELSDSYPILSEEGGGQWDQKGSGWIVDGLDGSANFHAGIPFFSVSIAFRRDSCFSLGVVYDALHDQLFSGIAGGSVTLNGEQLQMSSESRKSEATLLSGIAPDRDFSPESMSEFGRQIAEWKKVRLLGSAALSMAYLAAGRCDACLFPGIRIWDVAAGIALVEAAGGRVNMQMRSDDILDLYADNGRLEESLGSRA